MGLEFVCSIGGIMLKAGALKRGYTVVSFAWFTPQQGYFTCYFHHIVKDQNEANWSKSDNNYIPQKERYLWEMSYKNIFSNFDQYFIFQSLVKDVAKYVWPIYTITVELKQYSKIVILQISNSKLYWNIYLIFGGLSYR